MSGSFQSFSQVKEYLYGLKNKGAKYGIDRMRIFAERLGHPERRYPVIHVAGTNGKGSVVAMLESIFRAGGYRTGMFTSPHLVYQGERVQVNREILDHDSIVRYTNQLKPVAESMAETDPDDHPSFFEFMTAMAFMRFASSSVDIALIETGLGGRLDATNVVEPSVTVITSIALDHTEILGDSIEKIAREKAGILKPGVPVVMGLLVPAAEEVIRARAAELGCRVASVREVYGSNLMDYPVPALEGDYQRVNAATATLVVNEMRHLLPVSASALDSGLASVNWPGRWDRYFLSDREIIFDAAHNEEGAQHLERNLSRLVRMTGQRPLVVVGSLGTARARALLDVVSRHAREICLARPNQHRACSLDELESLIHTSFTGPVRRIEVNEAFPSTGVTTLGEAGEILVATGSIYLIGEIMEALFHKVPVNEHSLQD